MMKDLTKKDTNFTRIEFWAITTIFVFITFFFITEDAGNTSNAHTPNRRLFEEAHMHFNYYTNYFVPLLIQYVTVYGAFLLLNFMVVPALMTRESVAKNVFLIFLAFIIIAVSFSITNTYYKGHLYSGDDPDAVDNLIILDSVLSTFRLFLLFGFYSLTKYTGLYLLSNSYTIERRFPFVTRDGIIALIIWMLGMFLLIAANAHRVLVSLWGIIIPFAVLYYWWSLHSLIRISLGKKRAFLHYLFLSFLLQGLFLLPVFMVSLLFTRDDNAAAVFMSFNFAFQILITAPLSWVVFKRRLKGNEELFVLRKELGQTYANLDFLRSQINPHFLFNALNTIYGTAIQENAERTSEGIQKLGDMMRFMLQENMQEKIPLAREVDYLNNYISLQRLRTETNPAVQIQTEILVSENILKIAPMLLIPFVENAFKHGISLREPSHVKTSMETKNNTLYFDVYNSKHERLANDPEKDKSGIGLENVKQRLHMMYRNKHELVIRETAKEYFVHLTLDLG
jgi:hypothetical protein